MPSYLGRNNLVGAQRMNRMGNKLPYGYDCVTNRLAFGNMWLVDDYRRGSQGGEKEHPLNDKHCVTVGIEAVALLDSVVVGGEYGFQPCKGRYQC